ncbi:MAG: M20/M25/M40 family metallo-hydrolase, partial [Synergistaceae bacterium]
MSNDVFNELLAKVYSSIDEQKEHAFSVSDDIAAHPELSGEEFRTAGIFCEWLKNDGFDVEMPYCGMETAFIAKKGSGKPRVAILVETDALPEVGHGCGHNLSGTMSVLAGTALFKVMDEINGELLVIGTPAEETWGAKCQMADLGVMDDIDLAIMIHCTSHKNLVSMTTPALQGWNITFKGVASHAAAAPWDGRNAFNGARLFFDAMDMMRQHVRPEIRMHGILKECGTAVNTVPEKAVIHLELRAPDRRDL